MAATKSSPKATATTKKAKSPSDHPKYMYDIIL